MPKPKNTKRQRQRPSKKTTNKTRAKQTSTVRIIGGRYKSRQLSFISADGLRPTPDRLRETLFNWLMKDLYDATVLDCCAGSGVLGFEALSRGAANCVFIEANSKQYQTLLESARQLGIDTGTGTGTGTNTSINPHASTNDTHRIIHNSPNATIFNGKAEVVLNQQILASHTVFNVVFIDPPYDLDLWQPILHALIINKYIDTTTLIYIEANRPIEQIITVIDKAFEQTAACNNCDSKATHVTTNKAVAESAIISDTTNHFKKQNNILSSHILSNVSSPMVNHLDDESGIDNNRQASSAQHHLALPSFYCIKQSKVGQVYAGIYCMTN